MRKLSYNIRNWLAGFIDGEGCIELYYSKEKRRNKIYPTIYPRIIIANTNKKVIDYIYILFTKNCGYYIQKQNKNWKPCYKITFIRQKALTLLKIIHPYLKVKKDQAKLCLDFYQTIKKKQKHRKSGQYRKMNQQTVKKRLILYNKCKLLNKRGI